MNTLITGGYGLVGSALNFGFKPSKNEINFLSYDQIKKYIEENKIDSVIHAAGKVGGVKANTDFVYDFFSENIEMGINVMNACKEYKFKKAIFIISTCAFPYKAELPLYEFYLHDGEPHPTNYGYAYAKRMLEVGSRALRQQYDINSSCVIPCNLYGENDNYNLNSGHVIPSIIHKCWIAKQTNSPLEIWGSGNAEREFVYVKDFAKILRMIMNDGINIPEIMIISPGITYSIREIVEHITKIFKFNGKILFDKSKPEGIMKKNSSNKIFIDHFKNFKFTSLEEGLTNNIEYFNENYLTLRK